MSIFQKIQPYFKFTPGERRGVIVLLIIMVLAILLKVIVSNVNWQKPGIIEFEASNFALEHQNQGKYPNDSFDNSVDFNSENKIVKPIDPNYASAQNLVAIGFSNFAAQNIIKFREKGGVFLTTKDLFKIYGVDSTDFYEISKFLVFEKKVNEYNVKENTLNSFSKLIELNSADTALLEKISGIGPVLSKRIIKYRSLLGGFFTHEQLKEIYGLDEKSYIIMTKNCTIDTTKINKLLINTFPEGLLDKHPYISGYQAKAILKYRKLVGNFTSLEEIRQSNIFTSDEFYRIKCYFILK